MYYNLYSDRITCYIKQFGLTLLTPALSILLLASPAYGQAGPSTITDNEPPPEVLFEDATLIRDIVTPDEAKGAGSPVEVDTKFYKVTINPQGGQITSFIHKDPNNPLKNEIELLYNNPFYFDIYFSPKSLLGMRNIAYRLSTETQGEFTVVRAVTNAKAETDKGLKPVKIEKIYIFHKDLHYWDFKWNISNLSSEKLYLDKTYFIPLNKIGPPPASESSMSRRGFNIFYHLDNDFESNPNLSDGGGFFCSDNVDEIETEFYEHKVDYFGMASRFMLLSIQPISPTTGLIDYSIELQLEMAPALLAPGQTVTFDFLNYTGPKVNKYIKLEPEVLQKHPRLKLVHDDLYQAFDFGITAPIRDLIVVILQQFYKIIPNYGIGIIIFALIFKVAFFPLNQAQARSMKKMQKLQPDLKRINEKYKNNPQEKQKRTLELYKKHKANPFGGCLPMLIQIPIFIALYSAFSDAYELWRSPFIEGWINDLSQPDQMIAFDDSLPFIGGFAINVLPLIMVVSQYFQTKYTMVSGDANQQRMMQLLPVLMLFFFWAMPSGVVLYWIIFNLLSVLQQLYTNAKKEDEAA